MSDDLIELLQMIRRNLVMRQIQGRQIFQCMKRFSDGGQLVVGQIDVD